MKSRSKGSTTRQVVAAVAIGLTALSVVWAIAASLPPIWLIGAVGVFMICPWINFIKGIRNPACLSRRLLPDLRRVIDLDVDALREQGIPERYLNRYKKLAFLDYPRYRKGIRQLLKDMKRDGIDIAPLTDSVQRTKDASSAF